MKNTRTYQEDSKLSGYVMDLQTFDKVLLKAQKSGKVTIEKNMITDIQSATFEISMVTFPDFCALSSALSKLCKSIT